MKECDYMKKINLKVRIKNPTFWLTFLPTIVAFCYAMADIFGIVPKISQDNILKAVTLIVSALASLGVLVDPTTKGVGDSNRVMGYDKPFDDGETK